MSHSTQPGSTANGALGHEPREVNIKLILFSTVIIVLVVLVACFVSVEIFDFLNAHSSPIDQTTSLTRPVETPPEPRVLEHPYEQYPVLRQTEDRVLNSYGWLDQKTGQVRVPVDRAIDLIAQRGLPAASDATASGAAKKTSAPHVTAQKENSGK